MSEGRDLVQEALRDAKSLKEAAVESAKNQLVESLTPAVKELLNKSIKGVLNERGSKIVQGDDGPPHEPNGTKEQKKDYVEGATPELTLEDALQEFFPKGNQGDVDMATLKESEKKSQEDMKESVEG